MEVEVLTVVGPDEPPVVRESAHEADQPLASGDRRRWRSRGLRIWVGWRSVSRHGLALRILRHGEVELCHWRRKLHDFRVFPRVDEEISNESVRIHEPPSFLVLLQPAT